MPAFFMWQKYPTSWREACMMIQKYKWIFSYVWLRSLSKNNWKSLSHVWLFVTPWTTARQAPLSVEFFRPRILEWVAISISRGIFPTQRLNPGLPHCRQILYRLSHQGGPTAHLKIILTWRPGASLQEVIKCCFHYISLCNISNVTNLFSRVRVFSFFIQRP